MTEEYSQLINKFNELYTKGIVYRMDQFKKSKNVTTFWIIFLTIFCIMVVSYFLIMIFFEICNPPYEIDKIVLTSLFCICFGLSVLNFANAMKKGFEEKIKNYVMPEIASCFGDLTYYNSKSVISKDDFDNSLLMPVCTIENIDDVFVGKYNDVEFKIQECECWRGIARHQGLYLFDGVIVEFSMNKPFKGHTIIRPKNLLKDKQDFWSKFTSVDEFFYTFIHGKQKDIDCSFETLKYTRMEDINFENTSDTFTNDEVEARYLLTTAFIKRFDEIKLAFDVNNVSCSFYNNKMFLMLHTKKDLFSLGSLIKPIEDKKQFYLLFDEILSIIKLIDYFKLNQKIGL